MSTSHYRPLPEEMLFYARSDTHFLLYIYDCLRNLLLERSSGSEESVRRVLMASNRTALQVYTREGYDTAKGSGNNGWHIFLLKFGTAGLSVSPAEIERRKAVVIAAHIWRDRVAREEDESTRCEQPCLLAMTLWLIVSVA
jgi:exosome complex exonuclease RRP6